MTADSDNSLYDDLFDDVEIHGCQKDSPKIDEDEIQIVEEIDSQTKYKEGIELDLNHLQERILDSGKKFEEIEKRRVFLDEIIAELKNAVRLRQSMDQCASLRMQNGIKMDLNGKYVNPDTIIISIIICNCSKVDLQKWSLAANFTHINNESMEEERELSKTTSKVIQLPNISENEQYEVCLSTCYRLINEHTNFLVELTLLKEFRLDEGPRIFRIEFGSKLLTIWDLFSTNRLIYPPQLNSVMDVPVQYNRKKQKFDSILNVPLKMAFLLNGNKSPESLDMGKIILPNCCAVNPENVQINGYLPNYSGEPEEVEIFITKNPDEKNPNFEFVIRITTEKSDFSRLLIRCLKSKILILLSRVWRRPINNNSQIKRTPLEYESTETLWSSMAKTFS